MNFFQHSINTARTTPEEKVKAKQKQKRKKVLEEEPVNPTNQTIHPKNKNPRNHSVAISKTAPFVTGNKKLTMNSIGLSGKVPRLARKPDLILTTQNRMLQVITLLLKLQPPRKSRTWQC